MRIETIPLCLGAFNKNGELEAVVIKNGNKYPIIYSVDAMDFDTLKDFLKDITHTPKIEVPVGTG